MCSATHAGLRVLRSNAEVVDRVGRRSDIGPGKPYWNSPEGLTGVIKSFLDRGTGNGAAGFVGVGTVVVEVGGSVGTLRSRRDEKNAAEAAAPVAADTPAMMARVVFDILSTGT